MNASNQNNPNNNNNQNNQQRKGKGRQKIEMVRIENENNLEVTFSKRRTGLFKKASELSTLTGAQSAIVVFTPRGKVHSFGDPDVDTVANHFIHQTGPYVDPDPSLTARKRAIAIQNNRNLTKAGGRLDTSRKYSHELNDYKKASGLHLPEFDQLNYQQLEELLGFVDSFTGHYNTEVEYFKNSENAYVPEANASGFSRPTQADQSLNAGHYDVRASTRAESFHLGHSSTSSIPGNWNTTGSQFTVAAGSSGTNIAGPSGTNFGVSSDHPSYDDDSGWYNTPEFHEMFDNLLASPVPPAPMFHNPASGGPTSYMYNNPNGANLQPNMENQNDMVPFGGIGSSGTNVAGPTNDLMTDEPNWSTSQFPGFGGDMFPTPGPTFGGFDGESSSYPSGDLSDVVRFVGGGTSSSFDTGKPGNHDGWTGQGSR